MPAHRRPSILRRPSHRAIPMPPKPLRCRPPQQGRHRIANLPESMPFRDVKAEPVGIGMQSRRLPHRDTAGAKRMNRPGRSVRPAVASRAGAKSIAKPGGVQFQKAAHRFRVPKRSLLKTLLRKLCMNRSHTGGERLHSLTGLHLPQRSRVFARRLKASQNPIPFKQFFVFVRFG
jgi:hypothetical protein